MDSGMSNEEILMRLLRETPEEYEAGFVEHIEKMLNLETNEELVSRLTQEKKTILKVTEENEDELREENMKVAMIAWIKQISAIRNAYKQDFMTKGNNHNNEKVKDLTTPLDAFVELSREWIHEYMKKPWSNEYMKNLVRNNKFSFTDFQIESFIKHYISKQVQENLQFWDESQKKLIHPNEFLQFMGWSEKFHDVVATELGQRSGRRKKGLAF